MKQACETLLDQPPTLEAAVSTMGLLAFMVPEPISSAMGLYLIEAQVNDLAIRAFASIIVAMDPPDDSYKTVAPPVFY